MEAGPRVRVSLCLVQPRVRAKESPAQGSQKTRTLRPVVENRIQ